MQKYYHSDIWMLVNEEEFFATRNSLIEYVKDNWEEYAMPVGDEINLISVEEVEGSLDIIITYEVRDYYLDTEEYGAWTRDTVTLEVRTVQITDLVSEL